MRAGIQISSLVPSGLVIESVSDPSDSIILAVRSEGGVAGCPLCGARSRQIHSRYDRQVADLPCAGKEIRLRVITRRFICEAPHCRRRIFAERFGDNVLPARSRRTARLECIVHHLGLALGGRPAASFAKRLMLPVSNDTLLRVVRRRTAPSRSSDRCRHRRLGLSTQSPLRNDYLRSRAATDRDVVARSRGRYGSDLARRSSRDQDRIPRSWRRLW